MQSLCRPGLLRKAQIRGLLPIRPARVARATRASRVVQVASAYEYHWLNKEPLVLGAGLLSWFAATNIAVPALGGKSLFGCFLQEIMDELAHFPVGPALTDSFWLYMVLWHVGLFLILFLGQIGVQGRKQGLFK